MNNNCLKIILIVSVDVAQTSNVFSFIVSVELITVRITETIRKNDFQAKA